MAKIYGGITELIGNTPLVELKIASKVHKSKATILAKIEAFNPLGSVKDRAAFALIEDAEKRGMLDKNSHIIEPTSGNTGIGLAYICAVKGYKCSIIMPDTMSQERQSLIRAFGATVVLTPGSKGMTGAIEHSKEMIEKDMHAVALSQFENPANPAVHYSTTGPEIWRDTDGKVDIFIAGVGTCGTITGVSKFLKEKNPSIISVAVEPDASAVLSGDKPGPQKIQGIGAGFIPKILDISLIDDIVRVKNEEAFSCAREIAMLEGVFVGISSGAALHAAYEVASRDENQGKTIVVVLPDTGERYLSTGIFQD